jgi:hypothetical protein
MIFKRLIFLLLLCLAALPANASAAQAVGGIAGLQGKRASFVYTVTNADASIVIELWRQGLNTNEFLLSFEIRPNHENAVVSSSDEARALEAFFAAAPLAQSRWKDVTCIYFRGIHEPDVLARIASAAELLAGSRGRNWRNEADLLLVKSGAYERIEGALKTHGLRIRHAYMENVLANSVKKGKRRFLVPYDALVTLELMPDARP